MSNEEVPKTMRAVVLEKWKAIPVVKNIPVPEPKQGEVLVKVMACPINPMDNAFLRGQYSTKRKPPTIPGSDASGIVVKSGGDSNGQELLGEHVNFIAKDAGVNGAWCEYAIADVDQCAVQLKDMPFELTCNGQVNPWTCMAMYEQTVKEGHKAVIVTAAAASIGRMIHRLFSANGLTVVNVVRNQEEANIILKQDNAKYVLISEDKDFHKNLKKLTHELRTTCLWDVVSGPLTGIILNAMPTGSIAHVFGVLSLKHVQVDAKDLIFKSKKIEGFWFTRILRSQDRQYRLNMNAKVRPLYATHLRTAVSKQFALEQVNEAVEFYKKNMILGKVLLRPQLNLTQATQESQQLTAKL